MHVNQPKTRKFLGLKLASATVAAGVLLACSAPPKTKAILDYEAMRQAEEAKIIQERFPELFKKSEANYREGLEYHNDGDDVEALHFTRMATIIWRTAAAQNKIREADNSIAAGQNRIRNAQESIEVATARRDTAQVAVNRMERLQKMEQEMRAQQAALEKQAKAKKATEKINGVLVKLKEVEAMDAERHAPGELNRARASFQNAREALVANKFQEAEGLADLAMKDVLATMAVAKPKYDVEQKARAIEARLKAVAESSSSVPTATARIAKRGVEITVLEGELFKRKKTKLLSDGKAVLGQAVKLAQSFPEFKLLIEAHTDNRGRARTNLNITTSQSQAVMNHLIEGGISPDRITSIGQGEEVPIQENSTRDGRSQNRRVNIVFLRPSASN
ncbi:MAG: OmpA family protein [Bradymonadia bacterium]